ncbi:MAG: hypothetical protein ACK521_12405 [bacterium]|jgi:hypothetical protein
MRDSGVITPKEFSSMVDKSLYKEITQILFKVISAFRHSISSEKQAVKGGPPEKKTKPDAKASETDDEMSAENTDSDEEFDLG